MYSPFHSHFPTLASSLVHCLSYLTFIIVASCLFCNFYFIVLYICVWVFDFIFAPPPAMSLQPYINATYIRLCLLVCFILHGVSVVNPCLVSFLACLVLQHDFCNLFYFITISAFLLLQSRYSLAAKMSLFNRFIFVRFFLTSCLWLFRLAFIDRLFVAVIVVIVHCLLAPLSSICAVHTLTLC